MKKLIALIVAGSCLGGLSAKEFYVSHLKDAGGNPYYEGAPEGATIYTDIQTALNKCDNTDCTVWVEDGFVCDSGDQEASGHSRLNVSKNKTVLRSRSGDWRTGVTVIGKYATDVDTGYGADAIRCMVVNGGTCQIIGFKFENGATRNNTSWAADSQNCGGGVYVYANAAPQISNCCFSACRARYNGGGVCGKDANIYRDCFFENCKAGSNGSGFSSGKAYNCVFTNMSGTAMVLPSVISNCTVTASKTAVSITASGYDALVEDCWFTNNANHGIVIAGGHASIYRTVIANNTSDEQGAGIYVKGGSAYGEGLTITNNVAANVGGGTYNMVLNRCSLIGNSSISTSWALGRAGGAYGGILSNCVVACNFAGKTADTFDAGNGGGGTYNAQCIGCVISNNVSGYRGGGMMFDDNNYDNYNNIVVGNDLKLVTNGGGSGAYRGRHYNSLFVGNKAAVGAALDCSLAVNCTVTGNTTESTIYRGGIDSAKIVNTISWGNTPASDKLTSASNSCFKAAASFPDAGNIAIDPKFRTVDGLPYYPGAAKCRNSGLGDFDWMTDPADPRSKDVYGNARIQGSAPDMGAAECVSLGLMLLFR